MTNQPTSPAMNLKRYRVHLSEVLSYCVDVLATSSEEAAELAIDTELKWEANSESFDVDFVEVIPPEDSCFSPLNECVECNNENLSRTES
jgi:formylmethanofuran dehydrogenase subunit E